MSIKLDSKQQEEIFQNLKSQGVSDESLGEISGGISLQPSSSYVIYTTLAIGEEHPWWP